MPEHNIQFLDLNAQRTRIGSALDTAIGTVIEHGQFILGPEVRQLEQRLCEFSGARHCISCANGTDALSLILMAEHIGPGDAVIVPAFTFVATAEAPAQLGATPVFCDVDEKTFNISAQSARDAIDQASRSGLRAKAMIAVDLFGHPADYEALAVVAREADILLIADGAQSFGASLNGQRVGTLADYTSTSFFPAKPLGCYGDGGAIFTSDSKQAETLRSLRAHGKGHHKYAHNHIGMNSRLDTLQAAILLEKLKLLQEEQDRRNQIARHYQQHLPETLRKPGTAPGVVPAWAQYTVCSTQRDTIMKRCKEQGIPTAIYYPTPLHLQEAYCSYPRASTKLPVSERLCQQVFSLPIHPYLHGDELDYIAETLNQAAC